MGDKLKAFFDNKATWLFLGTVAGAIGEKAAQITNALGLLVQVIL